jgi:hypothetical protein
MEFYIASSEENHVNIRVLDGGRIHSHMKKTYIGKSEENHENLRAFQGGCVHWHMKKLILANLWKITRISGPYREAVFIGI